MAPYRGPKRGPARACTSCGRTHHSAIYDRCTGCRGVNPTKRTLAARAASQSDTRAARAAARAEARARDRQAREALRRLPKHGRCVLGRRGHPCPAGGIDWGRVDHDHCPELECGRPMAVGQPRCSRCDALLILQAPAQAAAPAAAAGSAELRPVRLPSLAAGLDSISPNGQTLGDEPVGFDDLPDDDGGRP